MGFSVNFNDIRLEDYCTILNINRSVLPVRENTSKSIPTMNGSFYTGFRYGEREISLDVLIPGKTKLDYTRNITRLANVINTNRPAKLILGDDPNKYYYAILDGDTSLSKEVMSGTVTLKFMCNDPIAYSDNWNTFTPGNKNIINLENYGSIAATPLVDIIFMKEACFFQAINQNGETLLIGKPKEVGKPVLPLSDIVVDDNCQDKTKFTTLATSLLDNKRVNNGSFGVGFNGNGIVTVNYGSGTDEWHGSGFRKSLGEDVSEFEVTIDVAFSSRGKNYEIPPKPVVPIPPSTNGGSGGSALGKYKVVNCGGLWINREPNDRTPIFAMHPGAIIYPVEIRGNWYKHTHTAKYGTYTGWSYGKYLQKISDSTYRDIDIREEEYAENQLGLLEVYGFDRNGSKLFKSEIIDGSEWFENVEPKMYIGGSLVLEDTKINVPIRTNTKEDGTVENLASGAVGRWNDLEGKIIIRREKNSKGTYLWTFTINKYSSGRLVSSMSTQNSLSNDNYPKGTLNYLGFFIGGYGNSRIVDVMAVTNIHVKKLNMRTDTVVGSNISLFNPGDKLQIDFNKGQALLNGQDIVNQIDIGSVFFDVPVGNSRFIVRSDDNEMIACCGIQEKFI